MTKLQPTVSPLDIAEANSPRRSGSCERNLILVHRPGSQDIADFSRIHDLVNQRASDIQVFIASTEARCLVTRKRAARRPTLVFSPTPLFAFKPARGKVYCGQTMLKTEQMRRLKAGGLPVPDWVVLEPYTKLDPATWGPFTILKPAVGTFGRGIALMRTCDVRGTDPFSWPADDPRYGVHLIAQKFVDTGLYPAEYRVLTVFGRPLYCKRVVATEPRQALDPSLPVELDGRLGVHPRHHICELSFEKDVLDLASATARVLAEVPVHAIDLVRDCATGALYVLEANPGGNAWHLSSPHGKRFQARFKVDFYAQFDALSVAADALIDKTRAEAE